MWEGSVYMRAYVPLHGIRIKGALSKPALTNFKSECSCTQSLYMSFSSILGVDLPVQVPDACDSACLSLHSYIFHHLPSV